jgi:hypothetical protein
MGGDQPERERHEHHFQVVSYGYTTRGDDPTGSRKRGSELGNFLCGRGESTATDAFDDNVISDADTLLPYSPNLYSLHRC